MKTTKEKQYNIQISEKEQFGFIKLGLTTSFTFRNDPKRLTFFLSRYKFVLKMLDGFNDVLEIGCGDGFGTSLVASGVNKIVAIDFDPIFIENAKNLRKERKNIDFIVYDILKAPLSKKFDAIYSLDVLEHIDKEELFMKNLVLSLKDDGVAIIGMPSLESQKYASKESKEGHINCKSGDEFKQFCLKYFKNVFLFSMNDEVVHTGFYPMAHYLIVLAICPKKEIL